MSELIVVGFSDENKADELLLELMKGEHSYRINLEDAAVVIRQADGQIMVKNAHPLISAMAAHGSFWGLLLGTLLLNPLAGVIAGGVVGAAVGSLKHIGIADDFIQELGKSAQPGSSLLFIMEHEATPSTAYHELKKYDGKVLRTSLGFAGEETLRKALGQK